MRPMAGVKRKKPQPRRAWWGFCYRPCSRVRLRLAGSSSRAAALHLATTTLTGLAHFALLLDAGLLIEAAAFDLLQDAFLRHLLLKDLHGFFEVVTNFNFEWLSDQRRHLLPAQILYSGQKASLQKPGFPSNVKRFAHTWQRESSSRVAAIQPIQGPPHADSRCYDEARRTARSQRSCTRWTATGSPCRCRTCLLPWLSLWWAACGC